MTDGELEFNNRPFVKHRTDNRPDRDDYGTGGGRNQYRQNFGGRDNNRGGTGSRGGSQSNSRDNNRGGTGAGRDNRNSPDNRSNNRNFKKRY